ncbi:MAG: hypothetical protein PHH85_01615 [Candidatus Methanoperedens sp.]|nr:hypothetical protein [Candidatus Methanoperedens sp.]
MTEVLNAKVENTGVLDLAGMVLVATVANNVPLPVIGSKNVISGVVKLIAGGMLHGKGGKLGKIGTGGLILGGTTDIVNVVMAMTGLKGINQAQGQDNW